MESTNDITSNQLKEIVQYDPDTGVFRWRFRRCGIQIGAVAGTLGESGCIHIKINGRSYLAHRLAWLYSFGEWPSEYINHINMVRDDNRLANLQPATNADIGKNKKLQYNNSSGYAGVTKDKATGKWRAHIQLHYRKVHLGYFDNLEDAVVARTEAKAKYHQFK